MIKKNQQGSVWDYILLKVHAMSLRARWNNLLFKVIKKKILLRRSTPHNGHAIVASTKSLKRFFSPCNIITVAYDNLAGNSLKKVKKNGLYAINRTFSANSANLGLIKFLSCLLT